MKEVETRIWRYTSESNSEPLEQKAPRLSKKSFNGFNLSRFCRSRPKKLALLAGRLVASLRRPHTNCVGLDNTAVYAMLWHTGVSQQKLTVDQPTY